MSSTENVQVADPNCPRCRELKDMLLAMDARLRDLEDEIKQLKGQDKPRKQEPIPPPEKKSPTGKKAGGQVGHKPHIRKWLPKERVNHTVTFVPSECQDCKHALSAEAQPNDPKPNIHQVYELPPQLIHVTQYEGHSRTCPQCAKVTHAIIPAEHRQSILGPKLAGMIVHQSGVMGLSKRDIEENLETIFELPISLGTISNLERKVSQALAPIHDVIRREVDQSPVKGLDETGWKQNKNKRWLWVGSTTKSVLFHIDPRRNQIGLSRLLPSKTGFAITDRWKVYLHWPLEKRQLCWAHLNRNWEKLLKTYPTAKSLHDRWMVMKTGLFEEWYRYKHGTMDREKWTEKIRVHEKYFGVLLSDGLLHANKKVAGFCERLRAVLPAAFTFGKVDGVEPTNNGTERVQRRAVMWRRTSFGCHSESGCRYVERILSVVETLRLRKQSVIEFLTKVITGQRTNQPVLELP